MGNPYGKRKLFTYTKSNSATKNYNYSDFGNGPNRELGAFRVVDADGLLNNGPPGAQPEIRLWEYQNIRFGKNAKYRMGRLKTIGSNKYCAITHVWDTAPEVMNAMNDMPQADLFDVDIGSPGGGNVYGRKTLSWPGLVQIAYAVKNKGGKYFWLDFLCMDQIEANDESDIDYMICIMADIYAEASGVIAMVGGAGCVQRFDKLTPWMDRAWPLQESIVNPNTFVLLKWPKGHQTVTDGTTIWTFTPILVLNSKFHDTNFDYCIVTLKDLLDVADATGLPSAVSKVKILDGMIVKARNAPRAALRAAIVRPTSVAKTQIRYTGVWRSLFMRTSSKPVDVIYSIMGIFGITIDPFRKNRDPRYLFHDLARKTAAKYKIGPAWLTIGGVLGSDIPPDPESHIIPKFPHALKAGEKSSNSPPEMAFGDRWEWVGHHVDHSPFFIQEFKQHANQDIKFMTHSHPHILNATMLRVGGVSPLSPVRMGRIGATPVRKKSADVYIGGRQGRCVYNGTLGGTVHAVFVGTVGDMNDHGVNLPSPVPSYKNYKYFLFLKWNKSKHWHVVANGVWKPPSPTWKPSDARRYIFTVGKYSLRRPRRWPADDEIMPDSRTRVFQHSYGIEPLADWRRSYPRERVIRWFNSQFDDPESLTFFKPFHVTFKIDDLRDDPDKVNTMLPKNAKLRIVSVEDRRENAPRTTTTPTTVEITLEGAMHVAYSYGGWPKSVCAKLSESNFDGILVGKSPLGIPRITYWARIWYGDQVMYLQLKKRRHTDFAYLNMYCIPYRRDDKKSLVVNADYLVGRY